MSGKNKREEKKSGKNILCQDVFPLKSVFCPDKTAGLFVPFQFQYDQRLGRYGEAGEVGSGR